MSGEFGKYQYRGYIDDVIRIIGDEMQGGYDTRVQYEGTKIIGKWVENDLGALLSTIAYNEADDSSPGLADLRIIDSTIKELQQVRAKYAEWLKREFGDGA
jgi:hypothetical protein